MNKLIIFDFDGVIADSFEYCLKKNQLLYKKLTAEQYRNFFCGNFYEEFSKDRTPEEIKKSNDQYWEEFRKDLQEIKLVAGMNKLLNKLSKKFVLVIVSSCHDEMIQKILAREQINQYFQAVYGSSYHESKLEKFKHVLRDFKVKTQDCIFITDTLGDLIESEKAGLESIAVSWGFHGIEVLQKGRYKKIIHKPSELIPEIKNHFGQ